MESFVKSPLREFVIGKDLARADVPEGDRAFLHQLAGPSLLRLGGRDPSRVRVVTTLLHGNEPSGLRAVIRFLRSGDLPATDVLFFIAAGGTGRAAPHVRSKGPDPSSRSPISST